MFEDFVKESESKTCSFITFNIFLFPYYFLNFSLILDNY